MIIKRVMVVGEIRDPREKENSDRDNGGSGGREVSCVDVPLTQ